jgi:hypothetical protein
VADLNAVAEVLLDLNWLQEASSEDRKAIGAAVGKLIDDLAASRKRD